MFLSVIVPTCNRHAALTKCLAALSPEAQGLNLDAYEVIVTDDSSDSATQLGIANLFPWVHWTEGPKRGPAANRNCGARKTKGDWLVFIDDDCIPNTTLLSSYQKTIARNPHFLVFEGATLAERPQLRMDEEAPINALGGYLWSCNFMIQRALYFEMGGFCELFPYAAMEDVDLRVRLKQAGHSFLFVPEASVIHPWRTFQPEGKHLKVKLVSSEVFCMRHPALRVPLSHAIYFVARTWIKELWFNGFQVRYRGITRWLLRTLTNLYLAILLEIKIRCRRKSVSSSTAAS